MPFSGPFTQLDPGVESRVIRKEEEMARGFDCLHEGPCWFRYQCCGVFRCSGRMNEHYKSRAEHF